MEPNILELYIDALTKVNYLAVIAAAASGFLLGFIWYSFLFRKPWAEASGVTEESAAGSNMPLIFGLSFVCAFLIALNLAILGSNNDSIIITVFQAAIAGLFFAIPSLGIMYLFERRSAVLFFINAGYILLMFILDGVLIALLN
jgi:hypothetical protein